MATRPVTAKKKGRGFTLIELLVVISIISLLMAILLPSLNGAKQSAYAIKCATNMRNVGMAMSVFAASNDDYYPSSYLYCSTRGAPSWEKSKQSENYQSNGYVNWSYFLFNNGSCKESAFECPAMTHRGIPRTDPGSDSKDWETGQVDMDGHSGSNLNLKDFQARRLAYAGNGAIIGRNKFSESYCGKYLRFNRQVRTTEIKKPSSVILATEFNSNWKASAVGGTNDNGLLVKSHRPITPFLSLSSGSDVYNGDPYLGFKLGDTGSTYGILPVSQISANAIEQNPLNAVGRHHPGSYGGNLNVNVKEMGGTANFVFCDGHVDKMQVLETCEKFLWGDRFYSITGKNDVVRTSK
jgi:prepilin-type N-terminal cleavage/methylation domain-containing protein/prepilin-type processing-associated H-X9-DG protein